MVAYDDRQGIKNSEPSIYFIFQFFPDTSLEPLEVLYIVVSCHAKLFTKTIEGGWSIATAPKSLKR